MTNNETMAYVAGLMDGEGSIVIAISKPSTKRGLKTPSHWLQVGIVNTNKGLIEWLKDTFNGHIAVDNSYSYSKNSTYRKTRPCYAWRVTSNRAKDFLKMIYPFLKIKQKQAGLAIEFQETKGGMNGGQTRTPEEIEKRNWYKQEISNLSLRHKTS